MQRADFVELFTIMSGLPVTIRLLDPPLHEFLPHTEAEIAEVAAAMGVSPEKLKRRAADLHEFNPMLGFRGCRLAIAYPEIAEMQARAIFEAAVEAGARPAQPVVPEIMVPLVDDARRARPRQGAHRRHGARRSTQESGVRIDYQVGTMIELPRAALRADEIARERRVLLLRHQRPHPDDARHLARRRRRRSSGRYRRRASCPPTPSSPSTRRASASSSASRSSAAGDARPDIKLGICGEHGGDPASMQFCQEAGLDYVSCSPYRVPIARLAAAQAALGGTEEAEG